MHNRRLEDELGRQKHLSPLRLTLQFHLDKTLPSSSLECTKDANLFKIWRERKKKRCNKRRREDIMGWQWGMNYSAITNSSDSEHFYRLHAWEKWLFSSAKCPLGAFTVIQTCLSRTGQWCVGRREQKWVGVITSSKIHLNTCCIKTCWKMQQEPPNNSS